MRTKLLAAGGTLLLVAGLITIGAGSARAHHNDITHAVDCGTTAGTWDVTWTVKNSEADKSEVITDSTDKVLFPVGTPIAQGGQITATKTFSAPTDMTLRLDTRWSNNYTNSATNQLNASEFPTRCAPPVLEPASAAVTTTDATCAAAAYVDLATPLHATWNVSTARITGPGDYSVTATADDDYEFADGTATQTFSGTLAGPRDDASCDQVVTPVEPTLTVTNTCGVYGSVTPAATEGVDYGVVFDKVTGDYTVTATPQDGFTFAGDQSVVFTGNVGVYAPCPTVVTPADPTEQDQVCTNGEITGGSIWVDLKDGVAYTIDGVPVTTATTSAEPGEHTVKAIATEGYVLSGDDERTWTIVIDAAENCDPPTLALVTPLVTWSNLDCDGSGSYTLAEANGIDGVSWTVNGEEVSAGTYEVKDVGTVTVVATPKGTDSFELGIDNPSTWALDFTAADDCDLVTLAMTGVDGDAIDSGLLLAGGLLLLGGALVFGQKRYRFLHR